ncbi:MAG: hypothetical protein ACRDS0_10950 [Pseudonocardiaceae bacterium]
MVRRAVAVVVTLLVSAVLLHLATPHHSTVPGTVSAQATVQPEISQGEPLMPGCSHPGPVDHHFGCASDRLVLVTHSQSLDAPSSVAVAGDSGWGAVLAGPVQACTARDRCSPSAAVAPTCVALQSFRC